MSKAFHYPDFRFVFCKMKKPGERNMSEIQQIFMILRLLKNYTVN